jgi:DNA-directed RNA polymerase specialized sigma24 family protein
MRRSEDAVKLLIYRARQTLRQCLEQAGEKA